MDKHGSSAITPADTTFISITLVRALAITGIIIENFHHEIRWNYAGSLPDAFTSLVATTGGTLVQMFFILSGYGLTLSCLQKGMPSWAAWASERFRKIVMPYWMAVVAVFATANLSPLWAPAGWQASYTGATLLAYLAFLRNVYQPAQTLNPSFWFMPVIIGLYALFPLLLQVMRRTGVTGLMIFSLLVANVSIAVCVHTGFSVAHQDTSPLFFVDEFALGMVLAWITYHRRDLLRGLMGFRFFLLGIAFCAAAAVILEYQLLGHGSSAYNDIFSAVGLYLMLLCICRWMTEALSPGVLNLLDGVSRRSYVMYLIHWPILAWVMKPLVGQWYSAEVSAIPMLLSAFSFVLLMYILAAGIARLTKKIIPSPAMEVTRIPKSTI
jgi:peptidoglycan/LPS O-acetylase OafA/YrhL